MRYFSRSHRCIAYSARGYTPLTRRRRPIPHLQAFLYRRACRARSSQNRQAHFVGLSMGSYSSLQVGLHRAGARAVDDTGRRRLRIGPATISKPSGRNASSMAISSRPSDQPKSPRSRARRRAGYRSWSRTRAAMRISMRRWRGTIPKVCQHHARLSGRPALDLHLDRGDPESADTRADHLRRRGRCLRRAKPVPEEAPSRRRADAVSEIRPCAQSRRACAVQRDGRTLHRAGRSRPLGARDPRSMGAG